VSSLYGEHPELPFAIGPVSTTAAFQELKCPGSRRLHLTITGQAIKYQLGIGYPNPQYSGPEIHAIPGVWIRALLRFDSIRFKSASGTAAVISIEARR